MTSKLHSIMTNLHHTIMYHFWYDHSESNFCCKYDRLWSPLAGSFIQAIKCRHSDTTFYTCLVPSELTFRSSSSHCGSPASLPLLKTVVQTKNLLGGYSFGAGRGLNLDKDCLLKTAKKILVLFILFTSCTGCFSPAFLVSLFNTPSFCNPHSPIWIFGRWKCHRECHTFLATWLSAGRPSGNESTLSCLWRNIISTWACWSYNFLIEFFSL